MSGRTVEFLSLLELAACHPVAGLQRRDGDVKVPHTFGAKVGFELVTLVTVVGELNGLIEADGDEQPDADGAHVNEELLPGKDGVFGRVDFHEERWASRIDWSGEGSIGQRFAIVDVMTKCVVVPLVGMALFTAAASGETWPSDAQVIRDVYGQVEAPGVVRWDASKEAKPSPYEGHSFAATGQEMAVEILLRGEVGGKLYVATSAVPKGGPVEYQCHACLAALGGAVYRRANGVWKLEASSPAAAFGGGWGGPPSGIEVRSCGPRTYCFVVENWFSGQGYSDSSLKIFGPVGSSVQSLLSVPVESDNDGAYDPKGVDGPDVWKRMAADIRFVADANGKSPFFDLEVIGVRRSCSKGRCKNSLRHELYRYRDGEYSAIELPTAP